MTVLGNSEGHFMPDSKEPSCWRAAGFAFAIVAGLVLVIGIVVGGDATATAVAIR